MAKTGKVWTLAKKIQKFGCLFQFYLFIYFFITTTFQKTVTCKQGYTIVNSQAFTSHLVWQQCMFYSQAPPNTLRYSPLLHRGSPAQSGLIGAQRLTDTETPESWWNNLPTSPINPSVAGALAIFWVICSRDNIHILLLFSTPLLSNAD